LELISFREVLLRWSHGEFLVNFAKLFQAINFHPKQKSELILCAQDVAYREPNRRSHTKTNLTIALAP